MSLKEFINEKKKIELNHKEETLAAIAILKQAADWLKGSTQEKPTTDVKNIKELVAKALVNVGVLDCDTSTEEPSEEAEEDNTEEPVDEELPKE